MQKPNDFLNHIQERLKELLARRARYETIIARLKEHRSIRDIESITVLLAEVESEVADIEAVLSNYKQNLK